MNYPIFTKEIDMEKIIQSKSKRDIFRNIQMLGSKKVTAIPPINPSNVFDM